MWGLNVVFSPDPRVRRNGTEYIRKHVPLLFLADRALLSITLQKIRAANVFSQVFVPGLRVPNYVAWFAGCLSVSLTCSVGLRPTLLVSEPPYEVFVPEVFVPGRLGMGVFVPGRLGVGVFVPVRLGMIVFVPGRLGMVVLVPGRLGMVVLVPGRPGTGQHHQTKPPNQTTKPTANQTTKPPNC